MSLNLSESCGVHMKKTLTCLIVLVFLSPGFSVAASQSRKSFLQWCQQQESVAQNTRDTIKLMLDRAGTNDCEEADQLLRNYTKLSLHRSLVPYGVRRRYLGNQIVA
jgi:hypothetical protein